jgi:hypothetical protein
MEKNEFQIFPSERMSAGFPWQIWAAGWLCIFKGTLWLAYEPSASDSMLSLLGYKYTLQTVPLIIIGIGIWNLRRWAVWGAVIICTINLILIIVAPQAFSSLVVKSEVAIWSVLLSIVTLLCNGPLGDLLILLSTPILLKYAKKT